jgi:hypothetical protein
MSIHMGVKLAGLTLSIALFCLPAARADEIASSCRISVGLSSWSPSKCTVREDGKTLSLHWPGAGTRRYWVELARSADGQSAQAVWNSLEGHPKADEKLGKLVLSENCWQNDGTHICFVVEGPKNACSGPRITQGMEYVDARKIVIASGFQAPSLPAYGYSSKDEKVISECSGDVDMCNRYPEIDACSGQGYCNMVFYDMSGNQLTITTYGDLSINNDAQIDSFELECK